MKKYNPDRAPDPDEWLALSEEQRMKLVTKRHKRTKIQAPEIHTAIHVVIENQLAEGIDVVRETLDRLVDEGLGRHEAIHAIGSVLTDHLYGIIQGDRSGNFSNEQYLRDLQSLTVETWVRDYG